MRTQRELDVRDWLQPIVHELTQHGIDVPRWHPFAVQAVLATLGDETPVWDEAWCEAGEDGVPVSAHLRLITPAAIVDVVFADLSAPGPGDIRCRRRPFTDLRDFTLHVNPDRGQVHAALRFDEPLELRVPRDPYRQPAAARFDELLAVLRRATSGR